MQARETASLVTTQEFYVYEAWQILRAGDEGVHVTWRLDARDAEAAVAESLSAQFPLGYGFAGDVKSVAEEEWRQARPHPPAGSWGWPDDVPLTPWAVE